MSKWQRYLLIAAGVVVIVGMMAIPPRPTTVAGWVRAALLPVAVVIWTTYRSKQREKEGRAEAGQGRGAPGA
jgi:membrane protein implicated in regulation of membrane protease activity